MRFFGVLNCHLCVTSTVTFPLNCHLIMGEHCIVFKKGSTMSNELNRQFSKQEFVKETSCLLILVIAQFHYRIILSKKYIPFTQKWSALLQYLHVGNFPTSSISFQPVNLSSCVRLIIILYTFQLAKLASCRISRQVANLATCANCTPECCMKKWFAVNKYGAVPCLLRTILLV